MKEALKNLICTIGGREKLITLLTDFYKNLSQDLMIGFFFKNKNLKIIAENQCNFMLKTAGLISEYHGKLPASAHLSLSPIFLGHFNRRIVLLKETLAQHKLTSEQIETWVHFENAFKNVVVAK